MFPVKTASQATGTPLLVIRGVWLNKEKAHESIWNLKPADRSMQEFFVNFFFEPLRHYFVRRNSHRPACGSGMEQGVTGANREIENT